MGAPTGEKRSVQVRGIPEVCAVRRYKRAMKRDKGPRERSATIRQDIIELMKLRPMTPFELSGILRVSEREAAFHLEHALESASGKYAIEVNPAHCRSCGFVFRDRRRVTKPSRCPRCKATRVEGASYMVREK
jgi:predicted Zn-ribbon and HTH transcriptional regulator